MKPKKVNVPSRRPAYDELFPTDEALKEAIEARKIVGSLLSSDTKEFSPQPLEKWAAELDLKDLRKDRSAFPKPFALRAFGGHVCGVVNTKIVPDVHGRVDNILLTVPPHTDQSGQPIQNEPVDPLYERHLKRLISLLGAGHKFTILCHHYQRNRVKEWLAAASIPEADATLVLSVFRYSIWAQDAYVALSAQGTGPILCEGVLFPRYDDMSIADDVAAQSGTSALQSILYFQGGNVLGGPDRTLIGKDYIWRNTGRANLEVEAKVLDEFKKLFGVPALSVGRPDPLPADARRKGLSGIYQPIFHIDMYVTPTGVTGRGGKEILFVGRPAKAREILRQSPGPYDFDVYFKETEDQLSQHYEVRQLPILPEYGNLGGLGGQMRYYHLTYNNAVVENYRDQSGQQKRIVYMPTFAEDATDFGVDKAVRETLDDAAAEIWKSAGFEVKRMDGLEDLAFGAGSVHCITKVVQRSGFVANNL